MWSNLGCIGRHHAKLTYLPRTRPHLCGHTMDGLTDTMQNTPTSLSKDHTSMCTPYISLQTGSDPIYVVTHRMDRQTICKIDLPAYARIPRMWSHPGWSDRHHAKFTYQPKPRSHLCGHTRDGPADLTRSHLCGHTLDGLTVTMLNPPISLSKDHTSVCTPWMSWPTGLDPTYVV